VLFCDDAGNVTASSVTAAAAAAAIETSIMCRGHAPFPAHLRHIFTAVITRYSEHEQCDVELETALVGRVE